MNPVLAILAILTLAGLLLNRREIGIPWAACGLAGIALLWPALRLPDGVPSPAATLAMQSPWQGPADPAAPAGNPNLRDVTYQVEPWLLFLRHETRAGRLPFWDPHQFSGEPYWSNGSGAPLFPLHLLFALLPLRLGWVLLPWLRIVIGGCGAWSLARELGASRPAALLAALVFPLSGMITSFLLFPMGNTHALIPWVLLAVERLAAGRGSWPALAAAGGLQMLGGHPETPVFTVLLAGVYLLARGSARPLAAWGRFAAGWAVAAAISAVQILPLFLTLTTTGKWLHPEPSQSLPYAALGSALLRLILPDLFGNPAEGTWWGPFNFAATALYAGALTLPLAAAGLAAARGDRRWRAVAVMALFALAGAYQLFGLRQVLLALPVIGRGLHHYMKFGVELGLALLAAAGCDRWLAGKGRGLLAGTGGVLALLAVAWICFGRGFREHGLAGTEAAWTAWIALLVILLAASLLLTVERRWSLWPLLPALLAIDLVAAHSRTNPGISSARHYPVTGAVRFLQGRPERVAGLGDALHPDAAMVYGLYDRTGRQPGEAPALRRGLRHVRHLPPGLLLPGPRLVHPLARPAGGPLGDVGAGGGAAAGLRLAARLSGDGRAGLGASRGAPHRPPRRGGAARRSSGGSPATGGSPSRPPPAAGWWSPRPGTPAGGPGSTAGRRRSSGSRGSSWPSV